MEGLSFALPPSVAAKVTDKMEQEEEIIPMSRKEPLDGIDCPICRNNTQIMRRDKYGILYTKNCECVNTRRTMKILLNSGIAGIQYNKNDADSVRMAYSDLYDFLGRRSFDTFRTAEQWQERMKARALSFVEEELEWLYIGGITGCGKTHLCTAVFDRIVRKGKKGVYVSWTDMVQKMAALRFNDYEYQNYIRKLREADVLYIDDLFKKKNNEEITAREYDDTFAIVNSRYIKRNCMTIFSSERLTSELASMDAALHGRIHERCGNGKWVLNIMPDEKRNQRLRKEGDC